MGKFSFRPSFLQVIYLIIYVVLFSLIVYIPTLISGPVHITEKFIIAEEIMEGSLMAVLFLINIFILNLYRKEVAHQKEVIAKINQDKKLALDKLNDSFKYIGQLNVQIQEIKAIFNNKLRLPETKNDIKKTFLFLSERVFGIVNTNWVLFRIINCKTGKTLSEQFETRNGFISYYPHIGNKMIVEAQSCPPFTSVITRPQNMNIVACCILPVEEINNDERLFIQAITNEITKMFVIFSNSYRKDQFAFSEPDKDTSSSEV
jgi:hypothetical protein